jgi:putative transposase
MARPLRIEYEGAVYHITARGNERRTIFFTKADYAKFLSYLREAKKKYEIVLHCYVLMTNHYHLIVETPEANISKVMHYINSAYTAYINIKRKRSGHLFQGRYKSIVVDANNYLLELSRYIHLNPVRANIVQKPEDYTYSSYTEYTKNMKNSLVTTDLVLAFSSRHNGNARENYRIFVESAIGRDQDNPMNNVYGGIIMGHIRFIKEILKNVKEGYYEKKEVAGRNSLKAKYEKEDILNAVSKHYNEPVDTMMGNRFSEARKVAIYFLKQRTGLTNDEIGIVFYRSSASAVAKVYQRFRKNLKEDRKVRGRIAEIDRILSYVKG